MPSLVVLPQDALNVPWRKPWRPTACGCNGIRLFPQLASHQDHVAVTIDKLVQESVGYAVAHTEWMVAKSTTLEVPFVIGADGHRSAVRRELDIEFAEAGEPRTTRCSSSRPTSIWTISCGSSWATARRMCSGRCPTAPVAGVFNCRISPRRLRPGAATGLGVMIGSAQYPAMTEEDLHRLIGERAPWFRGSVSRLNWQIVVRFERRLARAFGKQRVWLAGDAGHMTGPAGSQSMNVGLREADNLTSIIAGILRQGQPAGQLQTYNDQRLAEWRQLLGLDGGLKADSHTDPWIRQHAARLLPCLPATGGELARLAQQLGLRLA